MQQDPGTTGDPWSALAEKVAFLRRPESYPEPTAAVEAVQTHMSWVFLTDRLVYKLKKPVRLALLNLSTLDSRRRNCEAEVRWNRRLAPDVYLGVVPLARDDRGGFALGTGSWIVDWLVKMRRLPARRMLDRAMASGDVVPRDVTRVAETLGAFYRRAPRVDIAAQAYRERLRADVRDIRRDLEELSSLDRARIRTVSASLQDFLRRRAAMFDRRIEDGRIVEGHGDLRPEHVCLLPEPAIIDCVEFSHDLRTVDPADELSFLSVECELVGGPAFIEEILFETYARVTQDEPPVPLVWFYKAYRAFVRAKIAVWHLRDPNVKDTARWIERTDRYLELAERRVRASEKTQGFS